MSLGGSSVFLFRFDFLSFFQISHCTALSSFWPHERLHQRSHSRRARLRWRVTRLPTAMPFGEPQPAPLAPSTSSLAGVATSTKPQGRRKGRARVYRSLPRWLTKPNRQLRLASASCPAQNPFRPGFRPGCERSRDSCTASLSTLCIRLKTAARSVASKDGQTGRASWRMNAGKKKQRRAWRLAATRSANAGVAKFRVGLRSVGRDGRRILVAAIAPAWTPPGAMPAKPAKPKYSAKHIAVAVKRPAIAASEWPHHPSLPHSCLCCVAALRPK